MALDGVTLSSGMMDEVLAWERGEGTIRIRMPDGVSSEITVGEYRKAMENIQNGNKGRVPLARRATERPEDRRRYRY